MQEYFAVVKNWKRFIRGVYFLFLREHNYAPVSGADSKNTIKKMCWRQQQVEHLFPPWNMLCVLSVSLQ